MKELFIIAAGTFAGWVNVLAGGGSFLTLPALTCTGLGIDVANGTNRLAILLQNIVATGRFIRAGMIELKRAFLISAILLSGALVGSSIAVSISKSLLKKIAGLLLLGILVFMLRNRDKLIQKDREKAGIIIRILAFFGTGIYGGFIQAGVGFFLIYDLTCLEGMDVVEANAYKVFSILIYTAVVIPIFVIAGKFDLLSGLILSAANMLGAYLGTRTALKKGTRWVRWVLLIALGVSSILFILGI